MSSDLSLQASLSAGATQRGAGSVAQAAQACDQSVPENLSPSQALHAETGPASSVASPPPRRQTHVHISKLWRWVIGSNEIIITY